MAKQTVELVPSESKLVTFEAIPHEARTYQVSVDGLTGSFRAIAAPPEVVKLKFTGSLAKGETRYLTTIPSGSTELDITLEATDDIDLELWYWSTKVIGFRGKIDSRGPTTRTYQGDTFAYSGWYGGSEYIRADGPLSRAYTLQVYGHRAGDYKVNVSFLPGPPTPPVPSVEVTSISISKKNLVEKDPFTISITFSNPHDYDVWVRPVFGFGKITNGWFIPEAVLCGWEPTAYDGGYIGKCNWVDLGGQYSGNLIPEVYGSNMTIYIYDPDGAALVTGEHAYLKVPAGGEATTSLKWYIAYHARSSYHHGSWGTSLTEVFPPIDLYVCVKVESAFNLIYHPEGIGIIHYGLPEAIGKTRHYEKVSYTPLPVAISGYTVNVRSTKTPTRCPECGAAMVFEMRGYRPYAVCPVCGYARMII